MLKGKFGYSYLERFIIRRNKPFWSGEDSGNGKAGVRISNASITSSSGEFGFKFNSSVKSKEWSLGPSKGVVSSILILMVLGERAVRTAPFVGSMYRTIVLSNGLDVLHT